MVAITSVPDVVQSVGVVMDAGRMAVPEMNFPRVVHLQELTGEALGGGCTWPRWPTRAGGGRRFVQKCPCYPQVLQRYRIYSNKDPRCNVQTLFYFCFLVSINFFFLRFSLRFVIKIKSDKHYLLFKIVVVMFLFCFGLFGFFFGGGRGRVLCVFFFFVCVLFFCMTCFALCIKSENMQ